jgi:IS5 family transposase
LGVRLESASPGEVTLAEATLAEVKVPRPKGRPRQKPKRVIADRAYDSDPMRERLAKRGIDLIVPYRENSKAPALRGRQKTQALQTTLDHRSYQRLAWSVPQTPRSP